MTPHFTFDEMIFTNHREFDNTPNISAKANLVRTANLLEQVRSAIGNKPIIVNSAFRCKQINDAVGSKDGSQHRLGCAADIRVPGMTPDQVVKAIIDAKLPYDQLIREFDRWTHISVPNGFMSKPRNQALILDHKGVRLY